MVCPTPKNVAIAIGLAAPFLITSATQEYSATYPYIATAVGLAAIDSARKMSFNMFNPPKLTLLIIPAMATIYQISTHFFQKLIKTTSNSLYKSASENFQLSTLSFIRSAITLEHIEEHRTINASSIDHIWCKAKEFLADTYINKSLLEYNQGEEILKTADNLKLTAKNLEIVNIINYITILTGLSIIAYKIHQYNKQQMQNSFNQLQQGLNRLQQGLNQLQQGLNNQEAVETTQAAPAA